MIHLGKLITLMKRFMLNDQSNELERINGLE